MLSRMYFFMPRSGRISSSIILIPVRQLVVVPGRALDRLDEAGLERRILDRRLVDLDVVDRDVAVADPRLEDEPHLLISVQRQLMALVTGRRRARQVRGHDLVELVEERVALRIDLGRLLRLGDRDRLGLGAGNRQRRGLRHDRDRCVLLRRRGSRRGRRVELLPQHDQERDQRDAGSCEPLAHDSYRCATLYFAYSAKPAMFGSVSAGWRFQYSVLSAL